MVVVIAGISVGFGIDGMFKDICLFCLIYCFGAYIGGIPAGDTRLAEQFVGREPVETDVRIFLCGIEIIGYIVADNIIGRHAYTAYRISHPPRILGEEVQVVTFRGNGSEHIFPGGLSVGTVPSVAPHVCFFCKAVVELYYQCRSGIATACPMGDFAPVDYKCVCSQ